MARMNVNPTRMVLTTLKRQLKTAVRGHKLLKDKRDELMKEFLDLARENKILRKEVEEELMRVYSSFTIAGALMSPQMLTEALMASTFSVGVDVATKNVMSVNVPVFTATQEEGSKANIYPYGFAATSSELDAAIKAMSEVFPRMLELAEKEKQAALMAEEIEKTRRRVNALEYVKIPQLSETIRYIRMKLDENERGSQTRLMKVKDMIAVEAIQERRQETEAAIAAYERSV